MKDADVVAGTPVFSLYKHRKGSVLNMVLFSVGRLGTSILSLVFKSKAPGLRSRPEHVRSVPTMDQNYGDLGTLKSCSQHASPT